MQLINHPLNNPRNTYHYPPPTQKHPIPPGASSRLAEWGVAYWLVTVHALHVVKRYIPDGREDDADEEEDQPRHKNVGVAALLGFVQLARAVVGVHLMLRPAHGD